MTEKKKSRTGSQKNEKLGSALRNNLKKRKSQARKLAHGECDERQFVVKLRSRDIPKSAATQLGDTEADKK